MLVLLYILLVCYGPIVEPIFPKLTFGAGVPDLGFERITTYLLIMTYFFHVGITSRIDNVFNLWVGTLALFLAFLIASISWSAYSYNPRVLRYIFDACINPFMVAIVAFRIFKEKSNVNFFIINVTIASLILSAFSIYQMIWSQVVVRGYVRSTASFDNPNGLAIFIVLTIPCVLYAMENRLIPKNLQIPALIVILGGVFCTASRKGIVTGILSILIFFVCRGKKKNAIVFSLIFFTAIGILGSSSVFKERLSFEFMQDSLENKHSFVLAGVRMFFDHPVVGLGYEGYYSNFGRYIIGSSKDDRKHYDAHNIFVTALANYGIMGFIPFLGIFLVPLFHSVNCLKAKKNICDKFTMDLALITLNSIITFMLNGYFAGGLFYKQSIIILLYSNIVLFLAFYIRNNEVKADHDTESSDRSGMKNS